MITSPALQWVFTAVFLAVAVHCVLGLTAAVDQTRRGTVRGGWAGSGARAARRGGQPQTAIGHLSHLVMSLDMAAMAWPWWGRVPVVPQLAIFMLAAVWFAVQALGCRSEQLRWAGWRISRLGSGRFRRGAGGRPLGRSLTDMTMMLAMVWMVAVMGHGPDMTAASGSLGAVTGHQHSALPPAQVAAGLVLTVTMLASALACASGLTGMHGHAGAGLTTGVPSPHGAGGATTWRVDRATHRRAAAASTAMSAGMAAMCWLMVSS